MRLGEHRGLLKRRWKTVLPTNSAEDPNVCLNYIVSDRALPLFEVDAFTAQQAAALKPFFGKRVYDRFIDVNPFIQRHFPNFDRASHRDVYPFIQRHFPNFDRASHRDVYDEVPEPGLKKISEWVLGLGPVHVFDRISEWVLGSYLRAKGKGTQAKGGSEVLLGRRWIKLHLHGHKSTILGRFGFESQPPSVDDVVSGPLAPVPDPCQQENVEVQRQ